METSQRKELQVFAAQLRIDILEMLEHRGYGHLGGSLSIVELMSVLYGKQLHVDPKQPRMEDRDMVVLSKGHAGPAWYCALAEKGFFLPWSELHAFVFLGLGAGLLGFVYTAGMLDAYEQLVENEKYTRRLLFKLRKKVRTKIEQM